MTESNPDASRWADERYPDYRSVVNSSVRFSGLTVDYFTEAKAEKIKELVRRAGLARKSRLLDIGCGVGMIHPLLASDGLAITGVDVSEEAIATAREANGDIGYVHYDGVRLPVEPHSFDLAMMICVVHHIPPGRWVDSLKEAKSALRTGGLLMIFEHNPWNPLTRLVVNRCPFDHDAVLLNSRRLERLMLEAGLSDVGSEYILLSPVRSRSFMRIEAALRKLPIGAQYVTYGTVS
jgi:SAM-dependent methyltransferase